MSDINDIGPGLSIAAACARMEAGTGCQWKERTLRTLLLRHPGLARTVGKRKTLTPFVVDRLILGDDPAEVERDEIERVARVRAALLAAA